MSGSVVAKAAVAFGRGEPMRIEEITVRDPGPGEVRVRVAACGVCASDLHVWQTGEGITFPAVFGHEASGVVESIGPGVTAVTPGQPVVLAWIPRCGTCAPCRKGRTHLCTGLRTNKDDGSLSFEGAPLGRYMSISGFAELVVVNERAAIPVEVDLPLHSVCSVGCGVTASDCPRFRVRGSLGPEESSPLIRIRHGASSRLSWERRTASLLKAEARSRRS